MGGTLGCACFHQCGYDHESMFVTSLVVFAKGPTSPEKTENPPPGTVLCVPALSVVLFDVSSSPLPFVLNSPLTRQ